uniref:Ankyrin n=1 Tax=Serratia proteamaculans (strain 568) TaxID=399741 RepID=A8G8P6_SERP5
MNSRIIRLAALALLGGVWFSTPAFAALNVQLAEAARTGNLSAIKAAHLDAAALNESDDDGYTMLILAVYHDQLPVARYLLEQGADPNQKDKHGRTALMGAAFKGDVEAADILLTDPRTEVNLQNDQGQTAVMYAALFGHMTFLKHLVAKGAKVDVRDRKGNTAASLAEGQGNHALAQWLIKQSKLS